MSELLGFLWLLLLATAMVYGFGDSLNQWRRQRRSRRGLAALQALARDRGWTYQPSSREPLVRFGSSYPLSGGVAYDVITGSHGSRPFWCFECPLMAGSRRTGYRRRIVAVGTPSPVPTLQVWKRDWWNDMLPDSSRHPYDPDGAERLQTGDLEFDRQFRVYTEDEAFARTVLEESTRRWLMGMEALEVGQVSRVPVVMPLRFTGDVLMTWQDRRLTAPSVELILDSMCDVLDRSRTSVRRTGTRTAPS